MHLCHSQNSHRIPTPATSMMLFFWLCLFKQHAVETQGEVEVQLKALSLVRNFIGDDSLLNVFCVFLQGVSPYKPLGKKFIVSVSWNKRCVKNNICEPYVVYIMCINQMNTVLILTNVQQCFDVVLLQVILQLVSGRLQGGINKN